jgi:GGDEF domain-containing protein
MGGDQFVMLLDNIHSLEDGEKIANKIAHEISAPFSVGGGEGNLYFLTASIGVCTYPDHGR